MSEASGDIIIKGGSVQILFNEDLYGKDPSDPKKYSHPSRKIERITIIDENGRETFNSGDHPAGLKWTIQISTK